MNELIAANIEGETALDAHGNQVFRFLNIKMVYDDAIERMYVPLTATRPHENRKHAQKGNNHYPDGDAHPRKGEHKNIQARFYGF